MSKLVKGNPQTVEYWNERALTISGDRDVLFLDKRRDEFWRRTWKIIRSWSDNEYEVLDVCCGWGQFSPIFEQKKYQGIDFSENMLARAKQKYPKNNFTLANAKEFKLPRPVDVVFEVNSLHSLGVKPQEFFEMYKSMAKVAVACLEADSFIIYNLYQ